MTDNASSQNALLLSGVRVLECSHQFAGSLCAMMLAEQGADVVKIRPPKAANAADAVDNMFYRGKRHVTLDLK